MDISANYLLPKLLNILFCFMFYHVQFKDSKTQTQRIPFTPYIIAVLQYVFNEIFWVREILFYFQC